MRHAPRFGITTDELTDALLFGVPAAILGARLYYVLFRLDSYLERPLEIFMIWKGGWKSQRFSMVRFPIRLRSSL